MKTETFKGKVEQAYGKTLPKAVDFAGEFEAFESYDEIVKANEVPSNDEILTFVNSKRKAAARAKATTEALDAAGYAKPDPNSPDVIRENMIKGMQKLHGLTREQAEAAFKLASEAAVAVK